MAHEPHRSERDAALRAVLVQRAKATSTRRRGTTGGEGATRGGRLPIVATLIVLVFVAALSVTAIVVGQSRVTAASVDLSSAAPTESELRPSSTPRPSTTYSGPLIAMDGARSLTRAQLHAWTLANTDDSANAHIGEQQDWLDIQCMAEHGYLYDPTFDGSQGLELGKTWGLTRKQLTGYRNALWGENLNSSKPYDWRTAGCYGRAVHLLGQDNNN